MRIVVTKENIGLPWKVLLNTHESTIPLAATVSEQSESLQGVNGEIQLASKYDAQSHELVLRSWPDITLLEKDALISEITRFLSLAKGHDQELFYERTKRTYFVRHVGEPLKLHEYATWIEMSVPLKAHDPIGYGAERSATGVSNIDNRGNVPAFTRMEFKGPAENPSAVVNGTPYSYTGNVPDGSVLVVESRYQTAFIRNLETGVSTNANKSWNGNFLTLQTGHSAVQEVKPEGNFSVFWRDGWA